MKAMSAFNLQGWLGASPAAYLEELCLGDIVLLGTVTRLGATIEQNEPKSILGRGRMHVSEDQVLGYPKRRPAPWNLQKCEPAGIDSLRTCSEVNRQFPTLPEADGGGGLTIPSNDPLARSKSCSRILATLGSIRALTGLFLHVQVRLAAYMTIPHQSLFASFSGAKLTIRLVHVFTADVLIFAPDICATFKFSLQKIRCKGDYLLQGTFQPQRSGDGIHHSTRGVPQKGCCYCPARRVAYQYRSSPYSVHKVASASIIIHSRNLSLSIDTYQAAPSFRRLFRAPYLDNFHRTTHYSPTISTVPSPGNMADPDHMAEFQKLSNQYEPDLQGPLVGQKQSSSTITSEYANADPIYVAKTIALSHTHSHYRIMKGDGNCGWRAIAFGYFESLFNLRDAAKVTQELARMKSLNELLDSTGCQEHLYEMFVDATEELLTRISQEIEKGSYDDSFLLQAFNDEYNSSSIIMHFRLVTSAWMKLNPSRYADFLGIPLVDYCTRTIETVKSEIDQIGIQGLFDGVIGASGFAIEILYLDRSEGTQVTPHLLSPNNPIATIMLLYRPGHYDLLYRTEQPIQNQEITQVNYQYSMTSDYASWYSNALPFDLNPTLMAIPSLPFDTTSVPSPLHASQSHTYPMHINSSIRPPLAPRSPPAPSEHSSFPGFHISRVSTPGKSSELQIRMNPLVCEPMNTLPLTSVPFRNSPNNLAHFQNPDFQPSQWDPNEEYK
ncbi:uncharacterized protein PADG_06036 [Paracoccidioides brasiliensis Pb18]|uniref:ubiquitinyl hydrolase 1 n=1 Tax=Paracoccidioides brasiliensis (strain Pb18) TaxID=502780 RepID=C1GFK0_PARBD|nr:uncharacterized protein PADG_06036 [Paracoccidioides brasiliensis Pb18]EEH49957.2 hypothetical protein PADG_06036 [Paracoccidioides brasiliensis Pb18]